MARKEFLAAVKRAVVKRSSGICERARWKPGEVCTKPAKEFDHIIPDGLGGLPTLENAAHLCVPCHKEKSHKHDTPIMRRADAQRDAHNGVKPKSRPFGRATKPEKPPKDGLPPLPRRQLFA
jgi:5-methylcytosine-specific restriction protein A